MSLFVRARNVQRVEQSRGTLPPEAAHPLARVQTSRAGFCLLQKKLVQCTGLVWQMV